MARPLRVAVVLIGLGGCTSIAGLDDVTFRAEAAGGSTATGGTGGTSTAGGSTSSGGGGAGGTTPTGGGTGGGVAPCHPQHLVDDFDDQALNTVLWSPWSSANATTGEDGGVVWMAPGPNDSGTSFADIHTDHTYDLRNCSTWVEAVQVLDPTVPGQVFIDANRDGDNHFRILAAEGELHFDLWNDGAHTERQSTIYSPSTHRWWRIREADGTLFGETSPDAVTWSAQFATATPTWFTEVRITIGGGTWSPAADPGRAEFDNVNVTP
jgi:hypothetical protein